MDDDNNDMAEFAAQRERLLAITRRYFALEIDEIARPRRAAKDALRGIAGYVLGRAEAAPERKPSGKKRCSKRRALRRGWWELA